MSLPVGAIAELLKEITVLVRDFNDPAKRAANYRLKLEKEVRRKLETTKDYKHTSFIQIARH